MGGTSEITNKGTSRMHEQLSICHDHIKERIDARSPGRMRVDHVDYVLASNETLVGLGDQAEAAPMPLEQRLVPTVESKGADMGYMKPDEMSIVRM